MAALLFVLFATCLAVLGPGASAAPVTHGDLMLYSRGKPEAVQFRSPRGGVKATLKLKGFRDVSGGAVSTDARYAAVLGSTTAGALQVAFMRLGATPKVLGVRVLLPPSQGSKYCYNFRQAFALSATTGRGGSTELTVYTFLRCTRTTAKGTPIATTFDVRQWSANVTKAGKLLSTITTGAQAPLKVNAVESRLAIVNGRVYVSVTLKSGLDIRVYRLITSGAGSKAVAKLLLVWATKVGSRGYFSLLPTSATTGFALGAGENGTMYSVAKGRGAYAGGIPALYYIDVAAKGSTAYAIIRQGTVGNASKTVDVLRISVAELKARAKGTVLFKQPQPAFFSIAVVP